MTLTEVKKQLKIKADYLNSKEVKLSKDVKRIQNELFDLLIKKAVAELTIGDGGAISRSAKNFTIINNIDKVFDEFNKQHQFEVINAFGKDLLGVTDYVKEYYTVAGFSKKAILSGLEKAKWVERSIGYVGNDVIKGGYLDTLMKNEIVRQEVKALMIRNISSNTGLAQLRKDLKDYVKGVGEQAGKLERYYKQYAYDTFNQVDESINMQVADELDLQHFAYLGTEIKSTRQFCQDRIGGVFTRAEAEAWDNEDWGGKSGSFFPNRGGYNCRHEIGWISEELYNHLKK